jgi:hypothetical protein
VGDEGTAERSVDLQRATREPLGGLYTYNGRRGNRREVRRPTVGDDGDVGRSVDLQRMTSPECGSGMSRGVAKSPPTASQRGPLGNRRHIHRSTPKAGRSWPCGTKKMQKWCINLLKYNEIVARAKHVHVVLFEKAFPSSCQAQIMRTQML